MTAFQAQSVTGGGRGAESTIAPPIPIIWPLDKYHRGRIKQFSVKIHTYRDDGVAAIAAVLPPITLSAVYYIPAVHRTIRERVKSRPRWLQNDEGVETFLFVIFLNPFSNDTQLYVDPHVRSPMSVTPLLRFRKRVDMRISPHT